MESMDSRELVLDLVLDVLSDPEFARGPSAGIVMQAYLRDSEELVERVLAWAESHPRATPLTVRLVKGAYWDHETIEAAQMGWEPPVWTDKPDSDR
jgi:RHH-type proline utilization regulon transcriptional repressor/proline dehydrogenase/delta 1-pyrroline-5-carboxylate dehydrogenase